MKAKLKLTLFTFTFLLLSSYSIATPLSGIYTIGNGGNYPTIQSAFDDASAQGISGPVHFNVITGIYSETVVIDSVQGSDTINTITLQPITGNPSDVIINGYRGVMFLVLEWQISLLINWLLEVLRMSLSQLRSLLFQIVILTVVLAIPAGMHMIYY